MSKNKKHKYSNQLFDKQFEKIKTEFCDLFKSESIRFKGLWAFVYIEGANSLHSIYFNHVDIKKLRKSFDEILREIEGTCLDCDYGSLGYAFQKLNTSDESTVEFLSDTYNDPKGTVCYYDVIISQRHACFVIIKKDDDALGVLDFFFDGELDKIQENKIVKFFKDRFESLNDHQYLTNFINAFIIKEYGRFLELQNEKSDDKLDAGEIIKELSNAVEYIERIIASSSKTPLIIIKHNKRGESIPELVVLSYDFIHSIIKHEYRFCSLTVEKECFYFNKNKSFYNNLLCCENDFLKSFYYDVLKRLNARVVIKKINVVNVVNVEYNVEIVCSNEDIEIDISIFERLSYEVQKENKILKNDIAINKYRDERAYLELEKILKDKDCVYAFSLSRIIKPHLKFSSSLNGGKSDCFQRNNCIPSDYTIKQFISPSNILPIQYCEEENVLLKRIESERKNIVHFKINNEKEFKKTLKQLIAIDPSIYLTALKPYINKCNQVSNKQYKNLNISYIGESPLKDNKFSEIIKGKYSLIEAILHENEVKLQATRAAISQVMARNMSHNIGSHVLAKMITKDAVKVNFQWNKKKYHPIFDSTEVKDENVAIANFNSYLRDRVDFLADLSTATPLMEVSKYLLGDVIREIDGNRILMNYISGVSSFEYSLKHPDCCKGKHNEKDIPVSMPNDVMGFHAFFIILENVIRNTSKHGGNANEGEDTGKENQKKFTIEVRECTLDNTLHEVWVYDSSEKADPLTDDEKTEYKELTKQEADDEKKKIDLIVTRQNHNLNLPILDKATNELRHGAWGILEMKVAAAYLRKIATETIDESQYEVNETVPNQFFTEFNDKIVPNILKAVNKDDCLGYVFHVMKPKEVLIVDEKGDLYEKLRQSEEESQKKTKLQQLKDQGIWVQKEVNDKAVYPHPLMLVIPENGFNEEKYLIKDGLYRANLPTRILVQGQKPNGWKKNRWVAWTGAEDPTQAIFNSNKQLSSADINDIVRSCWRCWLKNKLSFLELSGKFGSKESGGLTPDVIYGPKFYELVLKEGRPDCKRLNFNFALDYHGKNIHGYLKEDADKCLFEHYEGYPSAVKPFLKKAKSNVIDNALLIDGILTNILIIDERIQAIYQEKYYPENGDEFDNNQKRMRAANIHIPDVDGESGIDLNKTNYGDDAKSQIQKCILQVNDNASLTKGVDYIVIHLGVIEKVLVAENKSKNASEVNDFIQSLIKISGARVVITSGRGKPDNLPAKVAFLSYSSLSHYAIETPFKAFLSQAIQSARTY